MDRSAASNAGRHAGRNAGPTEGGDLAPVEPLDYTREELAWCRARFASGSKTFSLASRFLPAAVREDVSVFYAYCRESDDLVDEGEDPVSALAQLRARLDAVFADQPGPAPVDRALAKLVRRRRLDRAPFDALLEGYAWDVEGRPYRSLAQLRAYSARVASSVGVVVTRCLGVEDRDVLARACDLGVAMQLTNIARDVYADLGSGRVYLPGEWSVARLHEALRSPAGRACVHEARVALLAHAESLYIRSESGVGALPRGARFAILVARELYAEIGAQIRRQGVEGITRRAVVSRGRKAWLILRAGARAWTRRWLGAEGEALARRAPALAEVGFLIGGGRA